MVKLRCLILKINPKEPFMSIVNTLALESNRQIKIKSLYLKKMRLHHSLRYQDSLTVWMKTL